MESIKLLNAILATTVIAESYWNEFQFKEGSTLKLTQKEGKVEFSSVELSQANGNEIKVSGEIPGDIADYISLEGQTNVSLVFENSEMKIKAETPALKARKSPSGSGCAFKEWKPF